MTGKETRALGYDNVYGPILDVLRDPRWGRCEEYFAEDPWLVGEYGIVIAKAIQAQGVTSTLKHFCIYSSASGARQGFSRTDPKSTPRENEYIHLWPWRRVMRDAKPDGVMCSYNDYDGEPIAASHHYLTDVLRGEMGFTGYVVSDSDAVEYLWEKHHVATNQKAAVRPGDSRGAERAHGLHETRKPMPNRCANSSRKAPFPWNCSTPACAMCSA